MTILYFKIIIVKNSQLLLRKGKLFMEYEKPVLICLDEKELASQILAMARSVNPGGCLYYGVYSWDAYNCSTGAVTGYAAP